VKLINSTDYPDYFLRRMVSWCCREIGLPVRYVQEAAFRKGGRWHSRRTGASGHAYLGSHRIVVTHGCTEPHFVDYHQRNVTHINKTYGTNCRDPVNIGGRVVEREQATALLRQERIKLAEYVLDSLLGTTAHELVHLWLYRQRSQTRRGGGQGGSEQQTVWHEKRVMEKFEARRDELLAAWGQEPAKRPVKAKPSLREKRASAAQKKLAEWMRKQKLATTKVKQYKAKVRYYDRAMAAKKPEVSRE